MNNNQKELTATIARWESRYDFLTTEIDELNQLLIRCGFPEGIKTLKETAEELLYQEQEI